MTAQVLGFWILAIFILASGVLSVRSTNIVRSAYSLIACFLGVAGLYAFLGFGFIALAQVLVYGGAIAVLLLFAIMTVMQPEAKNTNPTHPRRWLAGAVVLVIAMVGSWLLIKETVSPALTAITKSSVTGLAQLMMGSYVVPLEVAALLLLVALIGAIILVREA